MFINIQLFAHKKGGGSSKNGRDSAAQRLGVKAGDTVQLKKGDDIVDVKISIIVENYVRHYLYLAPDLYEELFGGAPDYNQLLMKYQVYIIIHLERMDLLNL